MSLTVWWACDQSVGLGLMGSATDLLTGLNYLAAAGRLIFPHIHARFPAGLFQ